MVNGFNRTPKWQFSSPEIQQNPEPFIQALKAKIETKESELIYRLRNQIFKIASPLQSTSPAQHLCIKNFAQPKFFRSWTYRQIGSKAERSYLYSKFLADHGVGVPEPIGFYEVWNRSQLEESFFITDYITQYTDLYSELHRLLENDPDCHEYLRILRIVATEIRKMHDCGFQHNDLGGQNIMLIPEGNLITKCCFIDLNRGKIKSHLSQKDRARDLAKLEIPSFLRKICFHFYFNDGPIPDSFQKWESFYRKRITFHNESRKYRHPIRHFRQRKTAILINETRPSYRDTWLWDSKTGQPCIIHSNADRKRYRSRFDFFRIFKDTAIALPSIWRNYQSLCQQSFQKPVQLKNKIGMSIDPETGDIESQLDFINQANEVPILIRAYHHRGENGFQQVKDLVQKLHASGHPITLALIQSRRAILNPSDWQSFVENTLNELHPFIETVEIGHAINRVKWGIWNLSESLQLWNPITPEFRRKYPHLKIFGPAVNDFEFHYYPSHLKKLRERIDSLSCHLYVDRRGAPENKQGSFSLLEKCALGKAIANHFGIPTFSITETNWPIQQTDIYSPIACPYLFPHQSESSLHVSPDAYAAFMIRYYLISLCSGHVDQVFWWRASSHGFGIIDELTPNQRRPAYQAFLFFFNSLSHATFLSRTFNNGIITYHFDKLSILYSLDPNKSTLPVIPNKTFTLYGTPIQSTQHTLSDSPIYQFH